MTDSLKLLEQRAIRAQAAVWVTDLHGPERSTALEADLRRWLAEDPRHTEAFELATEAWQRSGNLSQRLSDEPRPTTPLSGVPSKPFLRPRTLTALGATALSLMLASAFYFLKDSSISTAYGEQKTVELADGSEVSLNANSRVVLDYTDRIRQLTLTRGEALFNVAKHQDRPFVVLIGERKVIALGTSFEVRREETQGPAFTVTLIEGRVAVEPLADPNLLPAEPSTTVTLLNPGQRLRIAANTPDALDSPPIDKVIAWQRGQLMFEDTSLREAAQEFNRYGKRRLIIDRSVANSIRVGGVFRIGDPESFARAMANAYQLRIHEDKNEIKLTAP